MGYTLKSMIFVGFVVFSMLTSNLCSASFFGASNDLSSSGNVGVGGNAQGSAGINTAASGNGGGGGFLSNIFGSGSSGVSNDIGVGNSANAQGGANVAAGNSGSLNSGFSADKQFHAGAGLDAGIDGIGDFNKSFDVDAGGHINNGIGHSNPDNVIVFSTPPSTTSAPVTVTTATKPPPSTPKPTFYNHLPPQPQRPVSPRFKPADC